MKSSKKITESPVVEKMKKIVGSALFIAVVELCCIALTFIYGQRMSLGLEILIMIIGGVLLPLAIAIPRWQKWQQPHLPLEWWVQGALITTMSLAMLPTYLHGNPDACNFATVFGMIFAAVSLLLWLYMAGLHFKEMTWNRIWRQTNRH